MRKERFLTHRQSKLQLSGDKTFQVLEGISNNAYKLDLPGEYNVSATFNVADLSSFDVGNDLRSNPFVEKGNDKNHGGPVEQDALKLPSSPITRSKLRNIQEAMSGLIQAFILAQEEHLDATNLDCIRRENGANYRTSPIWNMINCIYREKGQLKDVN